MATLETNFLWDIIGKDKTGQIPDSVAYMVPPTSVIASMARMLPSGRLRGYFLSFIVASFWLVNYCQLIILPKK